MFIACISLAFIVNVAIATERDIVFLLDRSGSVSQNDYEEAIDFVYNVTKWLTIGPSNIQVSAVSFASTVREEFDLDSYTSQSSLLSAIDGLKSTSTGGGTYTHKALEYVKDNSLTSGHGARAGVPKAVIVLTDGLSANKIETTASASVLHNDSVEVYAIGIGNAAVVTNTELSDIASDPDSYYLHQVNLFQYLCSIVPEIVPKLGHNSYREELRSSPRDDSSVTCLSDETVYRPNSNVIVEVKLKRFLSSLDNSVLSSSIFKCPTPAPSTTPTLVFLNKSRNSDTDENTSDSGSSNTVAIAASVAAVGVVGAGVGAVIGVAKYLSMLKAQAPNPFVESIVAQYKDAPLGQGKGKLNYKFKSPGGLPAMPFISSKPPVVTAWH